MVLRQTNDSPKKIKSVTKEDLAVKVAMRKTVLNKLYKIDENMDRIKIKPKKRRKIFYEPFPLPRCTGEETNNDLMEIRGALTIKVMGKCLHVGAIVFRKKDQVEVNLHGEVYNGQIQSINSKELVLKTSLMQKIKIQISSIKKKMAIISKIN